MVTSERQRIAIVGSGISGLTAAYILHKHHDITVFEANDYVGGHTHTVPVTINRNNALQIDEVDTGFIVCNDRNYPNFLSLMSKLKVELQPTQMSFSVQNPQLNLEYNGHNLNTLFSQRINLFNPRFIRFVNDIVRFNKAAKDRLTNGTNLEITLEEFLAELRLGSMIQENYLLPMVSAIWSCSARSAGEVPLAFFLSFFQNHGLLDLNNRPQWLVVNGGSKRYVEAITKEFKEDIQLNCTVSDIRRVTEGIELRTGASTCIFDQVIVACHSDQALNLLAQPTSVEREILSNLNFKVNEVALHSDARLMPEKKRAWASWNFLLDKGDANKLPIVTYCMNILQGIGSINDPSPLLVSLNANDRIDPNKLIRTFTYAHPVFSKQSIKAQHRRDEICGVDRIHYCGAYWYNGFHEDGVVSALDVCARFGMSL